MRKKAISYIRFSTPEQLKGDSYRRQYDATKDYCKRNNLILDDTFYDEGISAYKGKHREGDFGKLLDKVRNGEIPSGTTLIVESLDRLSRENVTEQMSSFLNLINNGVVIVTLVDEVTHSKKSLSESPYNLLLALTVMIRSNEESATKSQRLSKAWENKRKNIAKIPLTSVVPEWLEVKDDVIVENKSRVLLIKEIFKMSLSGLGRRAIAKQLNQRQIPIWSSRKRNKSGLWTDSYIKKILANKAVLGEFTPHKKIDGKRIPVGKTNKSYYPQIIDEKLFWAVQHRVSSRTNKGGRGIYKAHNLFSSLLFCTQCGAKLIFLNKGKNEKYLACQNARNGVTCTAKNIKYDHVEVFVLQELISNGWQKFTSRDTNTDELQIKLDAKKAELASKKDVISNLLQSMKSVRTTSARETLAQSLDDEVMAKNSLQSEVNEMKSSIASSTIANDKKVYIALNSGIEDGELPLRRKLKSLIDENLKLAFIDRSKNDTISIIMVMVNGNLIIGSVMPKDNNRSSCTLENWQLNKSTNRFAIGYDLEIIDSGKIDAILKPKLISFDKGVDAVCNLTNKQSSEILTPHIASSSSKTAGIRKMNNQVKLRFQIESEDYEKQSPNLAVQFSTLKKIKSGKLWQALDS